MSNRVQNRIALCVYFFLSGFCIGSWTSRIPSIKVNFDLNEAELGTLLLTMPIASILGLPFSGWLVTKYESRKPLIVAYLFLSAAVLMIGLAESYWVLVVAIFLFAFCLRMLNIAANTQSIMIQRLFEKKIIGSFHALWSLGGMAGVGFSTLMVKTGVAISNHLIIVSIFTLCVSIGAFSFLIRNDHTSSGTKWSLRRPDSFTFILGVLVFFGAISEGGMIDWSGVYFKEVIEEEVFTLGYLVFMASMAISRFMSDIIMERFGSVKTYIISGSFIATGILISIVFPNFTAAMIGFGLVGFGTSAVFPLTFSLAGKSSKYSPGIAVAIITTYGMLGFLAGPPLIGYLGHAFGLQNAFISFVVSGLIIVLVSGRLKKVISSKN